MYYYDGQCGSDDVLLISSRGQNTKGSEKNVISPRNVTQATRQKL
jgi:hypothetical protein